MSRHTKIIAFVGLAGSGKTTAVDRLTEKGIPKVYFGGVLYDEMRREGIEITPDSQTAFRVAWRERDGKDIIVRTISKQLRGLADAGQHRIVADGLYSWTEYKILKHDFPGELIVVAIVAPKQLRHHRLSKRPERPFTAAEANDRDYSEVENIEKGGPIAMADHFIINDSTPESLYKKIDALLKDIDF